jgi:hypothetical protein
MRAIIHNENVILPLEKASSLGLGIRPYSILDPSPKGDIEYDENYFVYPDTGGLSTSCPPQANLALHCFTGNKKLFCIDTSILEEMSLKFRQDPNNSSHFFIEPLRTMLLKEFEEYISNTLPHWKLYNGE